MYVVQVQVCVSVRVWTCVILALGRMWYNHVYYSTAIVCCCYVFEFNQCIRK